MALCDGLDINIPLTVPTIVNKFVLLEREGSNEKFKSVIMQDPGKFM